MTPTVDHGIQTITQDIVVKATEVREGTKQKIKAWDLTGMGAGSNMKVVKTGPFNNFAGACTGHGGWNNFTVAQDHALGEDLYVNGVALPETPVQAPA